MNIGSLLSGAAPLAMLGGNTHSPSSIVAGAGNVSATQLMGRDIDPMELDPKTKQAMSEFESLFVSTLIKQMRQSVDGDGLFPGDKSDSLGGLFDLFMGQHLAQAGGLGMSQALLKSYTKTA